MAQLRKLKLSEYRERNAVLHAEHFLDLSEAWGFESLHHWLDRICDFSSTRVFTRGAAGRKPARAHSAEMAFAAVSRGRSLQISGLERALGPSDPLMLLHRAIQEHLGAAVEEIGMFFTPPSERALPRHVDEMDVLTLQLQGSKHWDVWTDVELKDCGNVQPRYAIDLQPGSILFVPAFSPHSVVAGPEESLSVAFPLCTRSYRELLTELYKFPGISGLIGKTVPARNELNTVRAQMDGLAAALGAISDRKLSTAIANLRRSAAQGKSGGI